MTIERRLKQLLPSLALALCALPVPAVQAADETLLELLTILRARGSISETEYELLRESALDESAGQEIAADQARQEAPAAREEIVAAAAPEWTSRIAFNGDMRVRYDHTSQNGEPSDRERGRLRYRLGLIADPAEGWEVGAGLASGGSDLRSTNQTFDDSFSTKNINLDYAYAQYSFADRFKVIGGKFEHGDYFYKASNIFLDSDINPEGVSANFTLPSGLGTTFANTGYWVMEENSDSDDDPHLVYAQLGQEFGSGDWFGTLAGAWLSIKDSNALGDIATDGSNTDFRFEEIYTLSAEFGLDNVGGSGTSLSVFSDFIKNADTLTDEDSGYSLGLAASRGMWEMAYIYGDLEANAIPDILPDSDRFGGLTGINGHEIILEFTPRDNVSFGLDYYDIDHAGINQKHLEFDTVVRF